MINPVESRETILFPQSSGSFSTKHLPNPALNQASNSRFLLSRLQQPGLNNSGNSIPFINTVPPATTILTQLMNQQRINQYSNQLYNHHKKMEQEKVSEKIPFLYLICFKNF